MTHKTTTIAVFSLAIIGTHLGLNAVGAMVRASGELSNRSQYSSELRKQAEKNIENFKKKEAAEESKHIARIGVFARFKPIEKQYELASDVAKAQQKSFFEDLFNQDLTRDMHAHYQSNIAPMEAKINSPYRRAQIWEMQQYDNSRSEMANWTAKEVLDNKLRDLFKGADKDSSAMQVISAVRSVTGGAPEESTNEKKMSPEEKIARAHRMDLPKQEEQEEHIPTKLRTRVNVIKKVGNLNFTNPIVTTNVDLNLGADDKLSVNMNKEFKKLKMSSKAQYGLNKRILNFNVNKTITDRISLDLNSSHYTGEERSPTGDKSLESARLNYSLSF